MQGHCEGFQQGYVIWLDQLVSIAVIFQVQTAKPEKRLTISLGK